METTVRKAGIRSFAIAAFIALLAIFAFGPASADARKIANPSPPDFFGELSGGFLQLSGNGGQNIFQLSLDFEELGLQRPSFRGTIDADGNIFVPQAQLVFPPLQFEIPPDTVNLALLPTAPATGRIDPLSGRVDFRVRLRIQGSGSAQGVSLGGSCFVGSAADPIDINGTTHYGTFPDTSKGVYVASFLPDGEGFLGGWQPAGPYTDEVGRWPAGPKFLPDFPISPGPTNGPPGPDGKPGAPLAEQIPYGPGELTDRVAGSFRIANDTLRAIGASGCGPLGLANGPLNDAVGLPSDPGQSTAVLDFNFVAGSSRPPANAIVQKGVKADFIAPGVSGNQWTALDTVELPTTVPATIDASSSIFTAGPNPGGRFRFDLGTGSFGPWTDTAVQPIVFATPGERVIRVQARDADGDIDTQTRTLFVVPSTDIGVTVSAVEGQLRGGSNGVVRLKVDNVGGSRANTQPITATATLPAGTSFVSAQTPAGWTCAASGPIVTCELPAGQLAGSSSADLDLTVAVQADAPNPLAFGANVSQAGDPNPANDSTSASIPVRKTDLTLDIEAGAEAVANGWLPYDIAVRNVGDAITSGNTTVTVDLPANFSYRSQGTGGTGWSCSAPSNPRQVSCVQTGSIAPAASAPDLRVFARIARDATGTATTSATVSGQGDTNAFGGINTKSADVEVQVRPDLAMDTSISGDYTVGDPGNLTMNVTNESVLPISGPTTVTSELPDGLTVGSVAGSDWDCSATSPGSDEISCSYAATIPAGQSAPGLEASLGVDHGAFPGTTIEASVANSADGFAGNNSDDAEVRVRRLNVSISKAAVRSFSVGIEGQYRLNVANVGDASTVGPIRVVDELPDSVRLRSGGASGGGWNCAASTVQRVDCVQSATVVPGSSAPVLNVRVDVLDKAAEDGEVINTATVDTERDDRSIPGDSPVTDNNESTATTTAVSVDVSIESTHASGQFRVGTVQEYSLKVRNVGFRGTTPGAEIKVTDRIPEGMVPIVDEIFTSRAGWECNEDQGDVVCILEAPDPDTSAMNAGSTATIDIPVFITDATADESENVAIIETDRDSNPDRSPNNVSRDETTVTRIDLELDASVGIPPRAGGIGQVDVDVSNVGTSATVEPTVVTIPLATGTSYRATGSTISGWQCASPGPGTQVVCSRPSSIPAGGSAPPLKIRTNVTTSAPNEWETDVTARTNGEPSERFANNDETLNQSLEKIDLKMLKSHDPENVKAGTRSSFQLQVENVGNVDSTGTVTVTDTVNSAFRNVSASGSGWSCNVTGRTVVCTRTQSIGAGETTPAINVGFDIPADASGSRSSTASLSSPVDPYPANNTASDTIRIVASADASVTVNQPASMRVGDVVSVSYAVRNVGTEPTSGSPSVDLRIEMPENLEPVSASSTGPWDCSNVSATSNRSAGFACEFGTELSAGATTSVNALVRVLPTDEPETGTLARVKTVGDVNSSNDVDFRVSEVTGVDLALNVTAPTFADMEAGETARRVLAISNVGSSATTGATIVKVPLPEGISWIDVPPYGAGWDCRLIGAIVTCDRNDALAPGASFPNLNIDLSPGRSNAPSVTVDFTVETQGDGDLSNNSVSRTDTVLFKPDAFITSGPSGTTTSRNATFEFESDDPEATFECKVDLGDFEECSSPFTVSDLSIGGHALTVRAFNDRAMTGRVAEASWTVIADTPSGNSVPITAKLTGGSVSLAALGEVELPGDQLELKGSLFENGAFSVPQSGVRFEAIEQTIPDALGPGLNADVKILIEATGPGSGRLPVGGGDATFVLPVQARLAAGLNGAPLINFEDDCALRPISFDLSGTYDEAAQRVTLGSPTIVFPQVSAGCGGLGGTINGLLELPRDDIAISLNFSLRKGPETQPRAILGNVSFAKSKATVRRSKSTTLTVRVRNTGNAAGTAVVALSSSNRRVASVPGSVRIRVPAGKTGSAKVRVKAGRSRGKATISARLAGRTSRASVTVR